MSDASEASIPEERGALEPPRRRPPTAIGLAGARPPQPPGGARSPRNLLRGLFARFYALALLPLSVGVASIWFGKSLYFRTWGLGLIGSAGLIVIPTAWIHSGAASRWALWRKRRWILRRQRELARGSRPSA